MKSILSTTLFLVPALGLLTGCGRGGDRAVPEFDPNIEDAKRRNAELKQLTQERDERARRDKEMEEFAAIGEKLEARRDARLQEKIDWEKLNGRWVAVSLTRNGVDVSPAELKRSPRFWTVDGEAGRSKQTHPDDKTVAEEEIRVAIDPSLSPKTIDLDNQTKKSTHKGIYEFGEGTLKICFASKPDDTRPTDFTAGAGSNRVLVVWERVKK